MIAHHDVGRIGSAQRIAVPAVFEATAVDGIARRGREPRAFGFDQVEHPLETATGVGVADDLRSRRRLLRRTGRPGDGVARI